MTDLDPEVVTAATRLLQQRKSQQAVILLTLGRIERDLYAGGWDQPPWLLMMYRSMPADAAPGEVYQLMAVQPLGVLPQESSEQLTDALAALAHQFRVRPPGTSYVPEVGPDMLAWVLVTEGWSLVGEPGASMAEQLEQLAQAGHIAEHPQRRESRSVMAVDRALVRYEVVRYRDGEIMVLYEEEPNSDQSTIGGALVEALTKLMEATP